MKRILFSILICLSLGTAKAMESDSLELWIDHRLLDYYRNERRHEIYGYQLEDGKTASNYFSFIQSEYDRELMGTLAAMLCHPDSSDYTNVASALYFVQTIEYAPDSVSKGVDEYVRYPIETLSDGMGDCEDKTILLAAIFEEAHIDYVLFSLPDHLALGAKIDGGDYKYLETTYPSWEIGQIPTQFNSVPMEILHPSQGPQVVPTSIHFASEPTLAFTPARCHLQIHLLNYGPGRVKNLRAHVTMKNASPRRTKNLANEYFELDELLEGTEKDYTLEFKSQIQSGTVLHLTLIGDNLDAIDMEMVLEMQK